MRIFTFYVMSLISLMLLSSCSCSCYSSQVNPSIENTSQIGDCHHMECACQNACACSSNCACQCNH